MKGLTLCPFVIICLFIAKTQTKDFCEEFENNGFEIDFIFDFEYSDKSNSIEVMPLFVIGYDYWLIDDIEEDFTLEFNANESQSSDVFGPQYLSAFTLLKSENDLTFDYGFIRKDSIIEWKDLRTDSKNPFDFHSIPNRVLSTSKRLPFPDGFVPNFATDTSLSKYKGILTFVAQNLVNGSVKEEYERVYFVVEFPRLTNGSIGDPIKYETNLKTTSKANDFVIGTVCCFQYKSHRYVSWVFYRKGTAIEYCVQTMNFNTTSVDNSCLKDRQTLIECKPKFEIRVEEIIGIILFGVIIGYVIVIVWIVIVSIHFYKWLRPDVPKHTESTGISQDVSTVSSSPTVKTIHSDTGKTIKKKGNTESEKKSVSQKNLFHQSVSESSKPKYGESDLVNSQTVSTKKPNTSPTKQKPKK